LGICALCRGEKKLHKEELRAAYITVYSLIC